MFISLQKSKSTLGLYSGMDDIISSTGSPSPSISSRSSTPSLTPAKKGAEEQQTKGVGAEAKGVGSVLIKSKSGMGGLLVHHPVTTSPKKRTFKVPTDHLSEELSLGYRCV